MVVNVYDDPYSQRMYAHKKRVEFDKLKNTTSFKLWRNRQIKIQNNECAYCRIDLSESGIVTHT